MIVPEVRPSARLAPTRNGCQGGRFFLGLIVLAFTLPLFAHGCHGGDEDHEPAVVPPVQAETPSSKDSR